MSETCVEVALSTELAPPREVTVGDVLERAADLLEEFGWCQGSGGMPWEEWQKGQRVSGPYCLLGAIGTALQDMHGHDYWTVQSPGKSRYGAAADLLGCRDPKRVWMWNDYPTRTAAEVVSYLRHAAREARE